MYYITYIYYIYIYEREWISAQIFKSFKPAIVVLAIIVLFKFKNLWAQFDPKKKVWFHVHTYTP